MKKAKKMSKRARERKLRQRQTNIANLIKAAPAKPKANPPLVLALPRSGETVRVAKLAWDTNGIEPEKVATIAASYRETGRQINPIQVRVAGAKLRVVAGRNRCEAAVMANVRLLRADILPYRTARDRLTCDLIEIDENLARKTLSPAVEADLTARRKVIYLKLYPDTRRGVAGGKARQGSASDKMAFAESAAAMTGKAKRTIQRAVARGEALGHDTLVKVQGTSLDDGAQLDALGKLDSKTRNTLIKKAATGNPANAVLALKQQTRNTRERVLAGITLALPTEKFNVMLEDFEWDFEVRNRETGMDRHAANHYPVSEDAHTPEEIVARTKDRFLCAAEDCALFMYATVPHLAIAIHVLERRGFVYKTSWAWGKGGRGTGYWNISAHEVLLLGTRGSIPAPAPGTQYPSLLMEPRGAHSEKPEIIYKMIEDYFPNLPKIELNARVARPGWTAWGLEAPPAVKIEPEAA